MGDKYYIAGFSTEKGYYIAGFLEGKATMGEKLLYNTGLLFFFTSGLR